MTPTLYSKAMTVMQQRVAEVDDTLSAQMIEDTLEAGGTWGFGSQMAHNMHRVMSVIS